MEYIAYYRVSTRKQGESGLGLEAQKEAVYKFTAPSSVVAEFTEIESGTKDNRIELIKAIAIAKHTNATLVIAKLDRLSRNASFIFALRDSKVKFVCVDMPDANTLTIGIMAVLAQDERERISKRTREALAVKKSQGFKLGTPANLTEQARKKGTEALREKALKNVNTKRALVYIEDLYKNGYTLKLIADRLGKAGMLTPRGKATWTHTQVRRVVDRYLKAAA